VFLLLASIALASERPRAAAIASAHPLATEAGHEVLAAGGNAFDAAVAVSAALAVVEPYSSGLGGGGFWLLHRAEDGFETMLDGRERAPMAAHRDLYLDGQGEVVPGLSIDGSLAAGIPGQPAALVHLAENYGRLPLSRSLAPAIRLARTGFPVDEHYRDMARRRLDALRGSPAAAAQFLSGGEVPPLGHLIRQPALAQTLEAVVTGGRDGFYKGAVAQGLVDGVRAAGGIWTLEDLALYRVVEREPIRGEYRGMRIISAAPPSSGGVVLVTMLNMLSQFDLEACSPGQKKHLIIEAMRRAYRDRARYLGDPDVVEMPIDRLIHPFYAAGLARDIDPERATPSLAPQPQAAVSEGRDTTHLSILDGEGNRVAATLSINYPFGSGFVPPGTGVLLNDEMDDFSARPGSPNVYGLVGGEANAIAPGKRMLSSMTPTFVETAAGLAILGTPGGSRIITMLLQAVLEIEQGGGPEAWVGVPRFHHQYLPDEVQYEPSALSADEITALTRMGHVLKPLERGYGNMQAVFWETQTGEVSAASDPRGVGGAVVKQIPH
jgi:gamma-glutamyltranspeptidase/glutathione hydrolase